MRTFARAAVLAAGLAAVSAAAAPAPGAALANDRLAPSLLSFSAAKAASAYELSATGIAGVSIRSDLAATLNGAEAASRALAGNLALDTGRGLDIASRFTAVDGAASPFLSAVQMPYLGLANGGRYGGLTFVPAANLRLRLGASLSSERLDHFSFDPIVPDGPLTLTYDASQSRSLLAGVSYQAGALGLDLAGISSERSGVPLGYANAGALSPKAATNALAVAAHMNLGAGWVTTATFSDGMTQLDQRGSLGGAANLRDQSYSVAIAKHGLFGDDSLGLALSRPPPGLVSNFGVSAQSEPALMVSRNPTLPGTLADETDIQVGYVTNFLDGAVALQTNAAYQTNFQGQRGATSVSLLSRAKIKF